MIDAALILAATPALAAAIAWGAIWLRPDYDLKPRPLAVRAALVAAPVAIWLATGAAEGRAPQAAALFFAALAALAAIDAAARRLPDAITYPLIFLGVALGVFTSVDAGTERLIGAVLGYASFWSLSVIATRALGREALGLGDAKLFAAIGAWLGWPALPEVALIASLAGLFWGAALAARGRDLRDGAPFGPALALGALVSAAFGPVFG